jgi:integrase/recombinase XerD
VSAYAAGSPGPASDEVDALLAEADAQAADRTRQWLDDPTAERRRQHLVGLRDRALLRLLADLGLRIGQALERDVDNLTVSEGSRVLRYPGRAGEARERVLPAGTLAIIDEYLAARAAAAGIGVAQLTGALFATFRRDGTEGRVVEPNVFMRIRSLARQAGIASADTWSPQSPQSLRHAFAAAAFRAGVALLVLLGDRAEPSRPVRGIVEAGRFVDRQVEVHLLRSFGRGPGRRGPNTPG